MSPARKLPSHVSGTYPIGRRESLLGGRFGHWHVLRSAPHGYWIAECTECSAQQQVRLDASQTHLPRCRACGARSTEILLRDERARFFARAKYLTGRSR